MRIVSDTGRALYDRDTAPGAEPEDLMRLDIPVLVDPGQETPRMPPRRRAISRSACRALSTGTWRRSSRRRRARPRGCSSSWDVR